MNDSNVSKIVSINEPQAVSCTNKIVICGDRNWTDFALIEQVMRQYPTSTLIIEGDCKGADKISGYIARKLGYRLMVVPAAWSVHGNRAGFIRNLAMLDQCPSEVLAFHDNINSSRGTKMMLDLCKRRSIPCTLYSHAHPDAESYTDANPKSGKWNAQVI